MLNRNNLRHHLSQKMGFAVLIGALLWVVLLAQMAAKMRDVTFNDTTQTVAFGPLELVDITKKISDHGAVMINFQFHSGILWYVLLWLALGAAFGYAVHRYGGKKHTAQD